MHGPAQPCDNCPDFWQIFGKNAIMATKSWRLKGYSLWREL
jgi:hypothetical protein